MTYEDLTYKKLSRMIADSHIIDLEIITHVLKLGFGKKVAGVVIKNMNEWISNKGVRHSAYNHYQMKKHGLSRIN